MRGSIIMTALVTLLGSRASAAEWWLTGASVARAVFVDASSVERTGDTARIWEYVIFREAVSGTKSSKRQKIVDCRTMGARLVQIIDYDEDDAPGIPLNYAKAPRGVEPAGDELTARAYRFACNDAASRAVAGATIASAPDATADRLFTSVAFQR